MISVKYHRHGFRIGLATWNTGIVVRFRGKVILAKGFGQKYEYPH